MYKLFLTIIFLCSVSCSMSDADKYKKILNAEELYIQRNFYGGFLGYGEEEYHIKKVEFETLLFKNEGRDYQTFVRMKDKKALLKTFIKKAYNTNIPDRPMSNSCMAGVDYEYILKSGFTTLKLRPEKECDSLFYLLLEE